MDERESIESVANNQLSDIDSHANTLGRDIAEEELKEVFYISEEIKVSEELNEDTNEGINEPNYIEEDIIEEKSIEEKLFVDESIEYKEEDIEEVVENFIEIIESPKISGYDLKVELFENLSSYAPIHLDIEIIEGEKEFTSLKKNIVIEKIGNFYITVLNDFLSRLAYFIYNGEHIIEWNNSFEEYLSWMENIVSKMYNISTSELKGMEKLVIIKDEKEKVDSLEENITWITRKEAIKNVNDKYADVIDLTSDYCCVNIKNQDDKKYLYIESQGLGINNFVNEEFIAEIVNEMKQEEINETSRWINNAKNVFAPLLEKPVLFIGLAAFPGIYKGLANNFTPASELPFVSLAWEI